MLRAAATTERTVPLGPDYMIRESSHAKHVRLKVSAFDGLIVVIPRGFDRRRIPALVEEKRDWIARAMRQVEAYRVTAHEIDRCPEAIRLAAIGRTWQVECRETSAERTEIEEAGPLRLRLSGRVEDHDAWSCALRRWLIEQGREHLVPWTEYLASEIGIAVHRVSVRCQKTRWGSYSSRTGTISLNAQLLFLPEELARFVLLHEICHAVHVNHSAAFWRLLRRHEPGAARLRVELRDAWRYVPAWAQRRNGAGRPDV